MWTEKELEDYLKKNLTIKRYEHSLAVRDSAVLLAKKYKVDEDKARLAGLIHDCAKDLKDEEILNLARGQGFEISEVCYKSPQILHGLVGAIVAKDIFKVTDDEILNAITYHTTGRGNMTSLEKIIYLADFIEPNRNFPGVEVLRDLAFKDLEKALFLAFDNTINFVILKGELLHPDTVIARNDIILRNNF
ncbi:MAG: bis(5'-nucleosyl)-tetraphosphatase (symmetrical) YqeK [Clostridiaceae bacterium]|nr:bis(5'-nucleosyl)-tetraphosphatase (symmetrical) YqeK [Clostridiaceae bacterium]